VNVFPFAPGAIHANYDVARDGERVVVVEDLPNPPIIALSNWRSALRPTSSPSSRVP
jgi:hypothetical protein